MRDHLIPLLVCSAMLFVFFGFEAFQSLPAETLPAETAADYPKNYFMCPVAGAPRLTGTFGELRPDHFHAGLDFKSATGKVGQPIFAAADGFVDQIKVQSSGYGNVLYLKHPNGYTTVYAHLDEFAPNIARWVKEQQYKKERFEIELNPLDSQFRFKKGQKIGKLGNSGSSSGPHLHFEIRNAATGKTINPGLFNLGIPDDVAPDLRDMKVYFLDEHRQVVGSRPLSLKKHKKGLIGLDGDTVRIGGWRVGFGLKAYDAMTGFRNDNGIYQITLHVDDQLAFQWRIDELDFDETRYMNAHVDYAAKQRFGAWFHRLFVLPGNRLGNYTRTETMGAIALFKDKPVKISLKVSDAAGNVTPLTFWALRDDAQMETFITPPYQYEFAWNADNRIDVNDFSLVMNKGALYEDVKVEYETSTDQSPGIYSSVHHVHNNRVPLQKAYDITLKPQSLPEELRAKAVIARCGYGLPDNCGGTWQGDRLTTRVRSFGDYCVMADTEPPTIKPIVFSADMRKNQTMAFQIRDNFAVSGTADGMSYRGTVDGAWILLEYDKKRSRLTHTFDGRISSGEHMLKLTVKDDRGNTAVLERAFRK